ncbi:plasmid partitioning protein RepB [Roseibium sediminicola]|uniref:Plasmid partitioning protein RepB n=1 Tax=Roseibium sediminicola TaxID=2933272 RepID=A0ABT0H3X9_9HYPH|nr:plasmid partitioning protein RepB [Roseibium sp. CAU 1639]MCK7616017.1 plasmid partitioning protein RepB [Roseibium sp. CAU 1639]
MSRKHALSELVGLDGADQDQPAQENKSRADYVRRGASRAMQKSLGDIAENAKLVAAGDVIVSLEPDTIDPSFFVDRLEEDDLEFTELLNAIKRDGYNSTPILVRPHPETENRYMIVYGHRRWKVAQKLGVKVRAVIKTIEDIGHVIAQGQENSARSNLSFIEKSMAAAKLDSMGQSRETIKTALSVDDALLSRMLSVATTIDSRIIFAIGAAKKIGRDRWEEMKRLIANPQLSRIALDAIRAPEFDELSSNERFELMLKTLKQTGRSAKSRGRTSVKKSIWTASDQSMAASIQRSQTAFQLKINSETAGEFGDYIEQNLDRLLAEYKAGKETDG